MMDAIIVENVRCFHTRHSIPLRPITVLVGENSSGKSTLLALARMAWDLTQGRLSVNFNEEPFSLGAFDQIACLRRGRGGRSSSFTIGAEIAMTRRSRTKPKSDIPDRVTVVGCFTSLDGQPALQRWVLDSDPYRVEVAIDTGTDNAHLTIVTPSGSLHFDKGDVFPLSLPSDQFLMYLGSLPTLLGGDWMQEAEGQMPSTEDWAILKTLTRGIPNAAGVRPYAFAPIRTQPKRTYDPLRDLPSPEGTHVPMILAKTYASDPEAWTTLKGSLDAFGEASGLFEDVTVKRMGRKISDPFQIHVRISGPAFNMVDVGYGVSQVLPILVDSLGQPEGTTFLLQQPEVHLHPVAQAELGSFLALVAKQQRKRFLIETHSDYLVDRIRMDVRDREYLKKDDVTILYFERQNGDVAIYPLDLDRFGNIVNAPSGYRQFFLEEEKRLLLG